MSQRGFDAWLTTEPDPFPIHFNFDPLSHNYDWCLQHAVQRGECDSCKCKVGITLIETGNGGTSGMITNYYQLDEDAELLWCEECHDYEPEEK
jgi:hypothetical protein